MSDITAQPYAKWLEECLHELVKLNPATIGIITIMPDGSTGTQYYKADNRDRLVMGEALMIDYLDALIRVNADHFRDVILGEEDDEDAEE